MSEILDAAGIAGNRREGATYLQAARSGLVPADGRGPVAKNADQHPAGDTRRVCVGVEGMWCPSCAWLVESVLDRTPGVISTKVTFFADLAEVTFDPAVIGEQGVARAIQGLGYRVKQEGDLPERGPLLRLGFAAFLQMNVMWLSYSLYAHRDSQALQGVAGLLPWVLAALSAPVIFVAGWPMLVRAWRALCARALVMDSLIALASISAWLYSVGAASRGSSAVYFDGASGLITFRLLGSLLEHAAFRSATSAGESVRRLLPRKARKLGDSGPTWVAVDSLRPGDQIRVAPGERVPLDGRVITGTSRVSTAVVDGESRPRQVVPGDDVPGGSVCGETALDLSVSAVAAASLLSRVADHVASASGRRRAGPDLADMLARLFIPGVLILSALTFALWIESGVAAGIAFERALSVLVVSCPCALGIAAPLARVVAVGALARRGIVVRGEGALDFVASASQIVLDKTGTLTEGRPALLGIAVDGAGENEALAAVAALEERAAHPIAQAVREALGPDGAVRCASESQAVAGCGVRGTLGGEQAWAGRPVWVEAQAGPAPELISEAACRELELGRTVILAAWDSGRWAALSFGDPVRPEANPSLAALRALGLPAVVLSGDSQQAAAAVATEVGASEAIGGCLPEQKAQVLEAIETKTGRRALFVGDGINDAPGLAAAIGVAVASGTDFARETADVLLLEPGLRPLPELVRVARTMRTVIRQNLAWAAVYNLALIPMAASGHLTPVWAAAAMVASGLLVTANALRLRGRRRSRELPGVEPGGRQIHYGLS